SNLINGGAHRRVPVSTYVTARGERATITLPDGNTVNLNVASRLEVPADYLAGNHTVHLYGEALFTILHHDRVPFTVVAGLASAGVLGTGCVVRRYSTDTTTVVAVRDGKVEVQQAGSTHTVVLAAAQQVVVDRSRMRRVEEADPTRFDFSTG